MIISYNRLLDKAFERLKQKEFKKHVGEQKKMGANQPNTDNRTTLEYLSFRFLQSLTFRNLSKRTMLDYKNYLSLFVVWCEQRGIQKAQEVSRSVMEGYQRYVAFLKTKQNKPLKPTSKTQRLFVVRLFFRWLTQQRILVYNPASEVILPRIPKGLPKDILKAEEVELILNQPDLDTEVGIRDRAILEVLYSTGIRRKELLGLKIQDLDEDEGILKIEEAKGTSERLVPIGQRAILWIQKYLEVARSNFLPTSDQPLLFLSSKGEKMHENSLQDRIKKYIRSAGLKKAGVCHLFRHSMATLMLKNGADIRVIQEILGHKKVGTTQIYTHLTIDHLKAVHDKTHPAKWKEEKLNGDELKN